MKLGGSPTTVSTVIQRGREDIITRYIALQECNYEATILNKTSPFSRPSLIPALRAFDMSADLSFHQLPTINSIVPSLFITCTVGISWTTPRSKLQVHTKLRTSTAIVNDIISHTVTHTHTHTKRESERNRQKQTRTYTTHYSDLYTYLYGRPPRG